MIPETGTYKDCKQALLYYCSVWPVVGEMYEINMLPKDFHLSQSVPKWLWVVTFVSRNCVELTLEETGGCTRQTFTVEEWYKMNGAFNVHYAGYAS